MPSAGCSQFNFHARPTHRALFARQPKRRGAVDYRLAEQLEAAGWPQGGMGQWVADPETLIVRRRVYAPTLEELIEACSDGLAQLSRVANGGWVAAGAAVTSGHGKDPTEAVALLWLELQRPVFGSSSSS